LEQAGIHQGWLQVNICDAGIGILAILEASSTSVFLGFALAILVARKNINDAAYDGMKSGVVGSLFSISASFGFGALTGFAANRLGTELAKKHNKNLNTSLSLNRQTYELLITEITNGNPELYDFQKAALTLM
jgi:hypothetical protein